MLSAAKMFSIVKDKFRKIEEITDPYVEKERSNRECWSLYFTKKGKLIGSSFGIFYITRYTGDILMVKAPNANDGGANIYTTSLRKDNITPKSLVMLDIFLANVIEELTVNNVAGFERECKKRKKKVEKLYKEHEARKLRLAKQKKQEEKQEKKKTKVIDSWEGYG